MNGLRVTPTFADGVHCQHGYPPGEQCPACGEIPQPYEPFEEGYTCHGDPNYVCDGTCYECEVNQ